MCTLREIWILHANKSNNMTSIKLALEVGNDEHIVLCNFGNHSISGFEVIEGGPLERPPPRSQD